MLLSQLLSDYITVPANADRPIQRLILDSRKINKNDLFLAINGKGVDGRQYVADAISRGVTGVIIEADHPHEDIIFTQAIPIIPIYQLPQKLGAIAAKFYGYPAKSLTVFGVTGTNGKTSCTHFIAELLEKMGIRTGLIGTLGSGFYGQLGPAGLTTPDAITLQAALRDFVEQGAKAVAMEVSSHSIDQGRVNGIDFAVSIFTNLTQDHLDYHGDMATYALVKKRFLTELPTKSVVINANDAYGLQWLTELSDSKNIYAYATQKPTDLPKQIPLIYADEIKLSLSGMRAMLYSPWGKGELTVPLIGEFNLSNILAVLTALCVSGMAFEEVLTLLTRVHSVPGRMQLLGGNDEPLVVVDYSHTPDSLEKVLQALRAHTKGKLICVFGCGGDRDQTKRPKMAKIAETFADQVIVTNDNPRHEIPETIAAQIMQGFSYPERVTVILDRANAIQKSIEYAGTQDCILVAGKGAEHYQQVGDEKLPFDDVLQVTQYLKMINQQV